MFEKFSDRARQVVVLAQEEARLLSHNYIGTEHLLLGVIDQGDSVAAAALDDFGLTAEPVRAEVEASIGRGLEPPGPHIPFTPLIKKSLEQAMRESKRYGDGRITPAHLLLGLLAFTESSAVRLISKLGQDPELVRRRVLELIGGARPDEPAEIPEPPEPVSLLTAAAQVTSPGPAVGFARAVPALDRYARNLDEAARLGRLNPVAGRDQEIDRLVRVLSRRTRNNAILTGEPGAGRMAIAEGLAQLIARGDAPRHLRDKKLYAVEFGLIAVGASDRSEAEWRVASLLTAIRERGDAIVVTEELAPFEGMPGDHGPLLGVFVRTALERQELQLITTATPESLRARTTADPRLAAQVQTVDVRTPDATAAVDMVGAATARLESHHHVRVGESAVGLVIELATGTLPGAAIDLLDDACAGVPEGGEVGEADVRAAAGRLRET
ncbi:Clp protease N-terminal domain-containing protein [Paractinoplanes globisporus]|uniref:Clp protease N-terminal domain-containing protein n=1 Tax=Paractinoplanes globisporus TaxID=113565 RepID=A0ABW6W5M9_9ACTN|nr:Clp protease N-terminal domain-containing protein [Actinoplanes globisporus]